MLSIFSFHRYIFKIFILRFLAMEAVRIFLSGVWLFNALYIYFLQLYVNVIKWTFRKLVKSHNLKNQKTTLVQSSNHEPVSNVSRFNHSAMAVMSVAIAVITRPGVGPIVDLTTGPAWADEMEK